jgi:hypothetical protein
MMVTKINKNGGLASISYSVQVLVYVGDDDVDDVDMGYSVSSGWIF